MDASATFTMKKSSGGKNAPTSNTANADHRRVAEVVVCMISVEKARVRPEDRSGQLDCVQACFKFF